MVHGCSAMRGKEKGGKATGFRELREAEGQRKKKRETSQCSKPLAFYRNCCKSGFSGN